MGMDYLIVILLLIKKIENTSWIFQNILTFIILKKTF